MQRIISYRHEAVYRRQYPPVLGIQQVDLLHLDSYLII